MIAVGFTGSQAGMTGDQAATFMRALIGLGIPRIEFHHGDCVGADAQAHMVAIWMRLAVVIHPPADGRRRAWCEHATEMRAPQAYMTRNAAIAEAADVLLAVPDGWFEVQRSGPWATVRRARWRRVPVVVIWPNGATSADGWAPGARAVE